MSRILALTALLAITSVCAHAVPFWGAAQSSPAGTAPDALKPGEFVWAPEVSPSGPMVIVVSLDEQRAYVYRNGVEIGFTTVSTGKPGHETPTGVFTILQKDKNHHSSLYNSAPMPYQERLTWDGVALHAGGLPGYPESHGCVHLPSKFAEHLFGATYMGMTVVIADDATAPADVNHPAALAPVDSATGAAGNAQRLLPDDAWRWQPENSLDGPVSIVLSAADQRLIVVRNGVEIGRSHVLLNEPATPVGTHAFIVKAGDDSGASLLVDGTTTQAWMAMSLPGDDDAQLPLADVVGGRFHLPQAFAALLYPLLTPGTTLLVTDAPVLEQASGAQVTVLGAGNPNS